MVHSCAWRLGPVVPVRAAAPGTGPVPRRHNMMRIRSEPGSSSGSWEHELGSCGYHHDSVVHSAAGMSAHRHRGSWNIREQNWWRMLGRAPHSHMAPPPCPGRWNSRLMASAAAEPMPPPRGLPLPDPGVAALLCSRCPADSAAQCTAASNASQPSSVTSWAAAGRAGVAGGQPWCSPALPRGASCLRVGSARCHPCCTP